MIAVAPLSTIALDHRARHVAVAKPGQIVAISKQGSTTLIAPDHKSVAQFELGHDVADFALSPDGNHLALLMENGLYCLSLHGKAQDFLIEEMFEACLFSSSGMRLWSARRMDNDMVLLEMREATSGKVLARAEIIDPFGDSGLMLFAHPQEDQVALWVAAGQDGQCIYWGHFNGSELNIQKFEKVSETSPPCFDRLGQRFMVVAEGSLKFFAYPSGSELGNVAWPLEDDFPDWPMAFATDDLAIVQSRNGRLFLVNVHNPMVADEIVIRGHEPRPTRELFPSLTSDFDLSADLIRLMPLPSGEFLSIHYDPKEAGLAHGRDQLLIWEVPRARHK